LQSVIYTIFSSAIFYHSG